MTLEERLDDLEKRIAELESKKEEKAPNKVITSYSPRIVQDYIRFDEERRQRGLK